MRDLSQEEVGEEVDSEMDKDTVLEKGEEQELHQLTAEFLRSPDAKDGDVIGRLCIKFFGKFLRIFSRRSSDRRRVEDAIQEAFKALQVRYDRDKTLPEKPLNFLYIVARNWLMTEGRKEKRRGDISLGDVKASALDGDNFVDRAVEAREPLAAVASGEIKDVGYGAFNELDERTRRIVELHREGKSWAEVAAAVGISSAERARKLFEHAVHHVEAALGAHFSSCLTTAEAEVRRCVNSRESALKVIDLLPPPSDEIMRLLLVEKKTEKEIAQLRKTSPEEIKRHHERAVEHLEKSFKMTEDELLEVLWHGR